MEKINIAELLKDCPRGMELDCTMYDNCTFAGLEDVGYVDILVRTPSGIIRLTNEGCYFRHDDYAKCVIFPKGKTTWEGFQRPFKDGDILCIHASNTWICIYREGGEKENICYKYVAITEAAERLHFVHDSYPLCHLNLSKIKEIRHATEEEKEKLFKAIKDNGYKWNSETKTLEKLIESKFKVGDKIIPKDSINKSRIINAILDNEYNLFGGGKIPFSDQDNWELAPNKFDITTLKPYDKVLARDTHRQIWIADLFSHKVKERLGGYKFACIGHYWHQCIPYEGNEHLLGKTDDCDEYFKTWK